jgi:DNA-binding NarL/FixJ family response regulator
MRVLLAEAQALIREGLKHVTLQIDAACEFIEAADAATARVVIRDPQRFDAAWFDGALFGADEIAALRQDQPRLLLLALVSPHDDATSERMLVAGINALVPKSASTDILAAALRLAIAGNVCVRGNNVAHPQANFLDRTTPGSRRGTGPLNLTSRQYDVLELIAQGLSNKAIAAELGIGLRTVKGHMSVILRALHADNRADAGRAARRWFARAARVREQSAAPA